MEMASGICYSGIYWSRINAVIGEVPVFPILDLSASVDFGPRIGGAMRQYSLKYTDSKGDGASEALFEAHDLSEALIRAHEIPISWPADVWEDGKRICSLERNPVGTEDFWIVKD
jgi:hypothetical protein